MIDFSNTVAGHQFVEYFVELRPRRLTEAVVAHDERGAGVELLVLLMPPGKLRADQVPGELVELHALHRGELRRLPMSFELLPPRRTSHNRDVARLLDDA